MTVHTPVAAKPKVVRRRRGTVIAYFLVLISVLTTSLVTTMALTAGGEAQVAGMTLKRDQAFYAAEAGIQQAYYMLIKNNNWRATSAAPMTGTVGNASFSAITIGGWNSPVSIQATGTVGTGQGASSITVTAVASPNVVIPAISLGNNFDNSGNVTITGDVQAKGNIKTSGRFREIGSLYAGGTITTNGSVDISGASAPGTTGITLPTVDMNWLKANANQIINVGNNPTKSYEVTSLNFGNGGIIYLSGSQEILFKGNVTIQGTGTLVTDANVTIHAAASFGSSSNPAHVNIISGGDLNVNGYLGLVGSVYTLGNITKSGGFDVTGIVVGNIDLDTNGGMTITRAQPPTYFQYGGSGSGAGSMVLSRITGPIF